MTRSPTCHRRRLPCWMRSMSVGRRPTPIGARWHTSTWKRAFLPSQCREGRRKPSAFWRRFIEVGLGRYDMRSHPDEEVTSGLSPYLHFGNVSPHQVFAAVAAAERWDPGRLGDGASGARSGWWGMSKTCRRIPRPAGDMARARLSRRQVRAGQRVVPGAAELGASDSRTTRQPMSVSTCTQSTSSKLQRPTTSCGMRHSDSFVTRGLSTTT